jgi:ABC-type siderophore export system fused ATPase/permease subunit
MSVNNKHIATFLLGAAAAVAVYKYMNMTDEEKDKLAADLKEKAHKVKDEAEVFAEKAKDYFEELKTKGSEALKEHMADAENVLKDLFGKKDEKAV